MTAYKRITYRRNQIGMSQEELAFRVGTNQRQISRYERGENDPTGEVLSKIADILNTTVDYLLERTNHPEMPLGDDSDLAIDEVEVVKILRSKPPEKRQQMLNVIRELAKV